MNTITLIRYESIGEKKYKIYTKGIRVSNASNNHHYQGASYWVLEKILPQLFKELPHAAFVDIGCGMGRVCFVANEVGFKKIIGFDLNKELINVANKNLNNHANIQFKVANALEYDYVDEPTIYFLFNPFNDEILNEVLKKIISISNKELLVVYMNPIYKKCFDLEKFKIIKEIKTNRYLEAIVYKNIIQK